MTDLIPGEKYIVTSKGTGKAEVLWFLHTSASGYSMFADNKNSFFALRDEWHTAELFDGPKRKIIQIAATPETEDFCPSVQALCDDGSVWSYIRPETRSQGVWERLPDIPQT